MREVVVASPAQTTSTTTTTTTSTATTTTTTTTTTANNNHRQGHNNDDGNNNNNNNNNNDNDVNDNKRRQRQRGSGTMTLMVTHHQNMKQAKASAPKIAKPAIASLRRDALEPRSRRCFHVDSSSSAQKASRTNRTVQATMVSTPHRNGNQRLHTTAHSKL
jgi:hypothetical protein